MRDGETKRWIRRLTTASSLLGVLGFTCTADVLGDDYYQQGPQAAPVYRYIEDTQEPAPAAPEAAAPAAAEGCATCQPACDPCAAEEEEADAPWSLLDIFACCDGTNPVADAGWLLGGHTQFGYQNDPDGAFTGNGPFLSQHEWNRFNLNQQYLYAGKVADGSEGLGLGGRVDLMYGVDGNEGQSFGNVDPGHYDYLNGWDHGIYEWALPQLYAEAALGDMSVKFGHFYTTIGYEVVPSSGQFFLSRQLTFWNSEPFTHTGALASYKASDSLSVSGGWVLGMDSGFYQFGSANAFLGGFTYQIDDDTSFVYSMTGGNLGWRGNGAINSMILSRKWAEKFTTVHQFDILGTDLRQADGTPADFADPASFTARDSIGLINYAFYDLNDVLKLGFRGEWYKADAVSYYTMTYGVNILTGANLRIRPEIRHMFSSNHNTYTGSGFNGQLFNNTVYGIDAIFTF